MKTVQTLPEGYSEIYKLDLQKDKKTALRVNTIAFAIAAVLAVPMHFIVTKRSPAAPERLKICMK